jgi:hypothetical protein
MDEKIRDRPRFSDVRPSESAKIMKNVVSPILRAVALPYLPPQNACYDWLLKNF